MRRKFLILVSPLLFFGVPSLVLAADKTKTQEFFVMGETATLSAGAQVDRSFTFYIADNINSGQVASPPAVKSAFFKISGIQSAASGSLQISVDDATFATSRAKTFSLGAVSAPVPFELIYKDNSYISPAAPGDYTYTLNAKANGANISGLSAKLIITYHYVPLACEEGLNDNSKTREFFVTGETATLSAGSQVDRLFTVYIGDNIASAQLSSPPAMKSAFFTITGIQSAASGSLQIAVDDAAFGTARAKTYTLGAVSVPTPFELVYKGTGYINPTAPGEYVYTLSAKANGVNISGLSAKFAITYHYQPPACGGFAAIGSLESSTFDTAISQGAAYNSLIWQGALGGPSENVGRVRIQLATSDSAGGPWTYYGPDCTTATYYEPAANATAEIGYPLAHNNKRYFRYKVTICSENDCATPGTTTPTVNDVAINWSP